MATDRQTGGLAVSLIIDRVTASRLGIAPSTIDNTLYDAFGQRQINTMYTQLNQYHVILEAQPQFQKDPSTLQQASTSRRTRRPARRGAGSVHVRLRPPDRPPPARTRPPTPVLYTPSSGVLDRATERARRRQRPRRRELRLTSSSTRSKRGAAERLHAFRRTTEPLSINHQGQFPAVTMSFNLAPNAALGARSPLSTRCRTICTCRRACRPDFRAPRPRSRIRCPTKPLLILAALVTVYIVLGVLYESFIHPVTILSTLPSAGVGALLALMLFRQDLSVVAIIGIILLIGIVKKNGIMMVDFALEAERKHGKNATDAIYEACLLRFRPIMMTTMAALLGGIPLALGTGIGSELRRPLGIAMVGGLLLSQVLTLYTTPVIYIFFDRLARRFSRIAPAVRRLADADRRSGAAMNPSRALHPAAGGHDAADGGGGLAGAIAFTVLPVSPLPAGRFPDHFRRRRPARRQRRDHGIVGRHAAGAAVRPHRRRHGDDLDQLAGHHGITLQFDLSRNIDGAARDVEAAINAARTYLPANLPGNPTYRKVNPADAPIMILGLTSDKYDAGQALRRSLDRHGAEAVADSGRRPGDVGGGALPSVRVDVNPTQLASYGLTLANVQSVLSLQNADLAKGQISDGIVTADIVANDQISHADDYKPLVVGYHNGAAVRLSDVANVTDSVQNIRAAGYLNGKRGDPDDRLPPARREHHRDRRSHPRAAAVPQGLDPAGHRHHHRSRPHHHHPRFGERRGADAGHLHRPGDAGGVRLPAQRARHVHSRASPCRSR